MHLHNCSERLFEVHNLLRDTMIGRLIGFLLNSAKTGLPDHKLDFCYILLRIIILTIPIARASS